MKVGDTEYGRFTVVFHNAEPSEAVRTRAHHLLDKLLQFHPTIMHGSLTVEGRHRHHHQGNLYHVAINLHLSGRNVVVSRDPERDHAHEDVYVALRDAYDAARKQLEQLEYLSGGRVRHNRMRFEGNPRKGEPF